MKKILFLLLFFPAVSFAATGYLTNGVCWDSANASLDSFSSLFPRVEGQNIVSLSSVSLAASGISGTISSQSLSTGATVLTNFVSTVNTCDTTTAPLTLSSIFSLPALPDAQTAWLTGFALPVIIYLFGWAFGVLLSMF